MYPTILSEMKRARTKCKDLKEYMNTRSSDLCQPPMDGTFGDKIDSVIASCTKADPRDRPSMDAVVTELEQIKIKRSSARRREKGMVENKLVESSRASMSSL
jgi:hypothetical protein